jgi:ATP-binding cassette subfamily G (WHITE) protein 2 (PDR)
MSDSDMAQSDIEGQICDPHLASLDTVTPNLRDQSTVEQFQEQQNPGTRMSSDSGYVTPSEGVTDLKQGVREFAQELKRRSPSDSGDQGFQNPFLGGLNDPALDPTSKTFSAKAWISNLISLTSRDPKKHPARTAGIAFRDLNVYGFGSPTDYQKDVANIVLEIGNFFRWLSGTKKQEIHILKGFDGLVQHGEMLVVLGRPGSGCSTLLKTISGDTHGLFVSPQSQINYKGISVKQMHNQFRGEAIYMAETDVHFPQLTVGQTLTFAAKARAPRDNTFPGVTREMYAKHMTDVIMATFGLSHTVNTNVGNDFIRGISGGERKRVSIAEAALSGSPLQCWDNCTRGLDSANAMEFCKALKVSTELAGAAACVSLYQAPQSAYDVSYIHNGYSTYADDG